MHGKIINYDSETEIGIISGEDAKNYTISIVDCRSIIPPNIDSEVNFEPHGDKATEIYVISSEVHPTSSHSSLHEQTHHVPKKPPKTLLPVVLIGSLLIFIGVLIYGELDRRNMKEVQDLYESQIKKIETLLISENCTDAKNEYLRAKKTRDKISKMGLYYSLDTHARQAHAIEIAECYAHKNEFDEAINMLNINGIHDPDYLLRASVIYKDSGDTEMADEARSMADKFDTSR
ncbi:MAG: hypothetical protein WC680_00020 [Sulfuricurvum sp.]|jgi:hypothetical protein